MTIKRIELVVQTDEARLTVPLTLRPLILETGPITRVAPEHVTTLRLHTNTLLERIEGKVNK